MGAEDQGDDPVDTHTGITIADGPRALHVITPHRIGPAKHVDHFVVFEVLGEGGMGTVYGAYDTKLDRKVAVKVVRADRVSRSSARERLMREAQAMARLAHPNVVTVLEVGEIEEDIFVALEYVDGTNLRRWLREPRSLQEIVAAFVQAGRGLAAAHEAGLVHRDFKPDNVLVRRDGRVQVTDFGAVTMLPSESSPNPDASAVLTQLGTRVGSPAYMAPEQHDGLAVDARADQFAFCVSLWEAVYKQRPFVGKTLNTIATAIRCGEIQPVPRDSHVPRWTEELLRRGLSHDPEDRWPDMNELLLALGRDRRATRRRNLVVGGVALVVATSFGIAWAGWSRHDPEVGQCNDAGRHLIGVWDPTVRSVIQARFVSTNAPFAESTARHVGEILDRWANSWTGMRASVCDASSHGEQSQAMLDARMQCLDRRLDELGALTTVLSSANRDGVSKAVRAAGHLPDVSACGDRDALLTTTPMPSDPEIQQQIATIRHDIHTAEARRRSGLFRSGRELATTAAAAATKVAYPPLVAEALLARGELEDDDGAPRVAEATLRDAIIAATSARDDRATARALVDLVNALAGQARAPEALALGIATEAAVARTGERGLEADLDNDLGVVHRTRGDFVQAEHHLLRALAIRRATGGDNSLDVAETLNLLGGLSDRRGKAQEARAYYERALAAGEAAVGADHPTTAVTRANLCHLDFVAGALAEARACQEQVAATLEAGLGPIHPTVAWALNDVALIQQAQGDTAGSRERYERALAIWEQTSGPNHPDVMWPLVNLGQIALDAGDSARATKLCRRAVDVVERAVGSDHPDLGFPLTCLGQALIETSPVDAVTTLRRALKLFDVAVADPTDAASARFLLARALDKTGAHASAITEAMAARDVLAKAGPAAATSADEVTAWLRQHQHR